MISLSVQKNITKIFLFLLNDILISTVVIDMNDENEVFVFVFLFQNLEFGGKTCLYCTLSQK